MESESVDGYRMIFCELILPGKTVVMYDTSIRWIQNYQMHALSEMILIISFIY